MRQGCFCLRYNNSVMPVRDIYHNAVKNGLVKDGWTITHDPLKVELGGARLYIDLGAEQVIGAEKGTRKIAVEIKTFGARRR